MTFPWSVLQSAGGKRLVSSNYAKKVWTNHELRAAQVRALEEGEQEYILQIRLDDTEIPGLLPTIKYIDDSYGASG